MLKRIGAALLAIVAAGVFANSAAAQSGEPIKIGFAMALTGPLAANGKQALLGAKIWEETVNKKGGLLGRPVKLIYYDDQSNPSTVPGIYTKLLDVDKVDLVVGPICHGTNRAGDAGGDAEGQGLHRPVRARGEQRVRLPQIFCHDPVRARYQGGVHGRILSGCSGAESKADDGRAGRGRPGILQERM